MRAKTAFMFLFAIAALSHALFLAGWTEDNGKISILCEGQREAFVSPPDGATARLLLDNSNQAEFLTSMYGPHTIQCGAETKTIIVGRGAEIAAKLSSNESFGLLLLLLSGVFTAVLLAAAALLFFRMAFGRTEFVKHVVGGTAKISLRAGESLQNIEISDPVYMGREGLPLEFSILSLSQGQEWSHEYEIPEPSRALPASLTAISGKDKVSLLSRIFIDEKEGAQVGKSGTAGKRIEKRPPKKAD